MHQLAQWYQALSRGTSTYSSSTPAAKPFVDPEVYSAARAGKKFSGLSNQGATCYLNSLIQTLFLSPDFRKLVYSFEFDESKHGPAKESIIYQLQRLFAQMQLLDTPCKSTDLTTSFGWEGSDVFTQHDVQELQLILLDALEDTFKGTPQEGIIERMFRGKCTDKIICLECQTSSSRDDVWYSLIVPCRKNLRRGILSYTIPDELNGDNKYMCDTCQHKCDARKGMMLEQPLPPFFFMQLKRFDYDPRTWNRIKVNTEMSIPMYTTFDDLTGRFCVSDEEKKYAEEKGEKRSSYGGYGGWYGSSAYGASVGTSTGTEDDWDFGRTTKSENDNDTVPADADTGDRVVPTTKEEEVETADVSHLEDIPKSHHSYFQGTMRTDMRKEGEYELYSIMLHNGSAHGGHYTAYVKDLSSGRRDKDSWFYFNDSSVSRASLSDLYDTFGVKGGSRNAYMIAYRRIDATRAAEGAQIEKEIEERERKWEAHVAEKKAAKAKALGIPVSDLTEDQINEIGEIDYSADADFIPPIHRASDSSYVSPDLIPKAVREEIVRIKERIETERKQRQLESRLMYINVTTNLPPKAYENMDEDDIQRLKDRKEQVEAYSSNHYYSYRGKYEKFDIDYSKYVTRDDLP
ncbi:hypothetical protein ADUPG1_011188, partial [Aduncisulcus paluster]